MATAVADATTIAATVTPATTAMVASAVVTVVEVTAATTGLLAVPLPRGVATTLHPPAARPHLPVTTTTAAATTRIRSFHDCGLASTGY